MKHAFGYCRVSTENQLDGDGLPRQHAAIETYAKANGFKIVRWFDDDVSGAKDAVDRPAFSQMLDALNGIKTVLIERLDRLARDVRVQETIIFNMQKSGWELISTCEPDLCSDDPFREGFRIMQGLFAQMDRKLLVRRMRAARDRNSAKLGRRVEGRKRKTTLHPEELAALPLARKLQKQGKSFNQVAIELNAAGIPAHKGQKRATGKWYAANVQRILTWA